MTRTNRHIKIGYGREIDVERLRLSVHCAEPGRKYNDQSLKNYSSFTNGLIKFDFSYNLNRSARELLGYPFEENV